MATYIQGIQTYIPQFQPYQPDYNFLSNVLQTKQSQYDQNYQQLSKTYGTLLSSPMLREDNIMKRTEFFKMIDNDIKRISGMDLSLQQNTDAANKVFDSFFQNKDLVHDMTYTKEYQRQLQIADNYKNCTDKTCDGKYWDVGVNALHYKADEYKKADKGSAMSMSAGKFVPQINLQEKTIDYLKDLLGKGGDGGFGIENITYSKDGLYKITTKNGANLSVPLQQLMQGLYGKDQKVIDMYNTEAYVNRKGFVQQNAERFGSEDAAEDEYFRALDVQYQTAQIQNEEAQAEQNRIRNRKNLLEENIKKYGSTGNDPLAKNYYAASVDSVVAKDAADYHAQTVDLAKSFFQAGEDRATRRQRADGLYARSMMNKEINESAIRAAAMTGSVKVDADPYAMEHYKFSNDMAKLQKQYDLMDRNDFNQKVRELEKEKALTEYKKRGSAVGPENKGVYLDRYKGTTDPTAVNEATEIQEKYASQKGGVEGAAHAYADGYGILLSGLANDPNSSSNDKAVAQDTLERIYGIAKKDPNGNYLKNRPGYDRSTGKFIDPYGAAQNTPQAISPYYEHRSLYKAAKIQADSHKGIATHDAFINGDGKKLEQKYITSNRLLESTTLKWQENNKNVRNWGNTKIDREKVSDWNALFNGDNTIKKEANFVAEYMSRVPGSNQKDASNVYKKMNEEYNKFYNQGNSTGKDVNNTPVPLIKPIHGSSAFNNFGGGRSAGGGVMYEYNSENPASLGNRGLATMYYDALKPGGMFTIGNAADKKEAEGQAKPISGSMSDSELAKTVMTQLMSDLKNGKLTETEADFVKGQIVYMDLALSDRNTVGAHIIPPASWLKTYKGTSENPSWADDERLISQGIGLYADKKTAENEFTKSFKLRPYDEILEVMDVPISDPNGGNFVIRKRGADGRIVVEGNFYGYDGTRDKSGNYMLKPLAPNSKAYDPAVGGENIYAAINTFIAKNAENNNLFLQTNGRYIKNVSELPDIQDMLRVGAGGEERPADPTTMFINGVQKSLYGQ